MPLIVICGHPCSGKSTVASRIAEALLAKSCDVALIDEESLHLTRTASYKDVVNEKNTRSVLRSAAHRSISRTCHVVFDSLNSIKGYRYELWCVSRGAATRYCMVHVDTPVETCREWNASRSTDSYSSEVFEDLAGRFERPDARNRWDAPLFTVNPLRGAAHMAEQVAAIVAAVSQQSATSAAALTVAVGAAPVVPAGKELMPTCATTNPALAATNLLHDIDKATQGLVDRVMEAQAAAGSGAPGTISFGENLPLLHLSNPVSLPELRRHKRTFLRLATNNTFNRLKDLDAAHRMFIDYLRDSLT